MISRSLDQFYTKKAVAVFLLDRLNSVLTENNISGEVWLEPAAGTGSFYNILPENKLGIDIDPKYSDIISHDFLTYNLPDAEYITIGNPPFGKNSSLAVKFFNKCAEKSLAIGFILPKTFRKDSIINRLDSNFHLTSEENLEKNSFIFEGNDYDVPCIFQTWIRKEEKRKSIERSIIHTDFKFTSKDNSSFAIQRVGYNAGRIKKDFLSVSESSHYFILAIDKNVLNVFESIDYDEVKYNTAGNPSISKTEIISLYEGKKNEK